MGESRPGGGQLLFEGAQFVDAQALAAELGGQADAVEAEFRAALPDVFEGGAVELCLGGDAVLALVGDELVVEVGAQASDEVLEARVVVVGGFESEGHARGPVQLTRRSAPAQ